MRLLNVHDLSFRDFRGGDVPPYATASHRWHKETEATLKDILKRRNTNSAGYLKMMGFLRYVRDHITNVDWLWIDTCCIRQESDREVSEAVNSMFRWYNNAEVCLAYLQDVKSTSNIITFRQSEWFKRGWTLQELLAPRLVIFLTQEWEIIGCKGNNGNKQWKEILTGPSLESSITQATGIPANVLRDYEQSYHLPIRDRLNWMRGRKTTCEEDMAYCLLGIFNVTMPTIYGEGKEKAMQRLLDEVEKQDNHSRVRTPTLAELQISPKVDENFMNGTKFDRPSCGKVSANRAGLVQYWLESPVQVPKQRCSICLRLFKSESALAQHQRDSPAHTSTYKCSSCLRSYSSKTALE